MQPTPPTDSSSPPSTPKQPRKKTDLEPRLWVKLVLALLICGLLLGVGHRIYEWGSSHRSTNAPDNAVVSGHVVDVAPEVVSGRIVRFLVAENDKVEAGQVLAEIDPAPYRDQVELSRARLAIAEAEWKRQQGTVARLKANIPLRVEAAKKALDGAKAEKVKAEELLKLTEAESEKTLEEARAAVEVSQTELSFAKKEIDKFAALSREDAAPVRRSQEAAKAFAMAEANVKLATARMSKAEAERGRITVARRTVEAAEKAIESAANAVKMAETDTSRLEEAKLAEAVQHLVVEEARRALLAAENTAKQTQIKAPFPGVVVRLVRGLGDFAAAGMPVLSLYDPDYLYVTAYQDEADLNGVEPGNQVRLHVETFPESFRGRVLLVNRMADTPGSSRQVAKRVPVRIWIEKDSRWPLLRPGLSVQATIDRGAGDPKWAEQATREMKALETRFNPR